MPPISTKQKPSAPDDAAFHRSLLIHNDTARNLTSWLSQSLNLPDSDRTSTSASAQTEDDPEEFDIEGDEEESGLGYRAPTPKLSDRSSLSANEKLRRQLLGSKAGRESKHSLGPDRLVASKPRPRGAVRAVAERDYDEDDDKGRTAVGGRKGKGDGKRENGGKIGADPVMTNSTSVRADGGGINGEMMTTGKSSNPPSKKRATSYLDEVLAKRQKKNGKN